MGSVLFKKINVVDVRQQRILPSMDVLVEGKKIAVIAEHIAETADRVIDGEGLYLTPGIIDLHVHALGTAAQSPRIWMRCTVRIRHFCGVCRMWKNP